MDCLIITGLSGAGKSVAVHALEDIGYQCVDNLPPSLIPAFVNLATIEEKSNLRLGMVCDVRGGESFADLFRALEELKQKQISYKILYLEASADTLVRRFEETRRRHPLYRANRFSSTEEAIQYEKKLLAPLYDIADYIIDTTVLSGAQLRHNIVAQFAQANVSPMSLKLVSFGFKHGTPRDADIIFDVRCLPNPFYVKELKDKTGLDAEVSDFVFSSDEAKELFKKILSLVQFSLAMYLKEGKSQLVIAFGCTGGHHRSVALVEAFAKEMAQHKPEVFHRDINR